MAYDTGLADRLRRQGLKVVEVAGWKTRGSSSFNPRGFVWHHTAGPAKGNAPSLTICTYGRAGLPGPLCNVFLARDNTVYVVAAGRANHAGSGRWGTLKGNSSVYGLEIENVGTKAEPWRADQLEVAARIAKATGVDVKAMCHHKEWTSRKVDMHTVTGDRMRTLVSRLSPSPSKPAPKPVPAPTPTKTQEVEMFLVLEGQGIFAVVDGLPVGFPNLQAYARAKEASPGTPVMTLHGKQAEQMWGWLTAKVAQTFK